MIFHMYINLRILRKREACDYQMQPKLVFLKFYFALDSDRSSPMVQRRPMITTTTTTTMTKTTKITTTVAMTTRKTLPIILNVALCKVLFL